MFLCREKKLYLIAAIILLAILWLAIAYFGVKGAIIYCLIFSFVVTSFSRLLFMWGRSSSSSLSLAQKWLPPVISMAVVAYTSLGIYQLVQFFQSGMLNTVVFIPWLVITLGGPALYFLPPYLKRYLALRHLASNCIEAGVSVEHEIDLPIYITELRFVNSANGRELEVPVFSYRDKSDHVDDDDKDHMSLVQKIDHAMNVRYFPQMYLPVGSDKFYLSWYSFIEDKYYQDEFPFSYDGFPLRTIKYDKSGNKVLPSRLARLDAGVVSIGIHYNGNVRLYRYSDMLLCYTGAKTKIIGDEEKNRYLQSFKPYSRLSAALLRDLQTQDKELALRQLFQRGALQKRTLNWGMRIDGLDEDSILDIDDVSSFSYRSTLEELSVSSKSPLPEKIEICYQAPDCLLPWLYIYLDVASLHRSIMQLTSGDDKIPVEFIVVVEDNHQNSIQFLINANGQSAAFNNWETTVKEEYKNRAKKLAKLGKRQKQQYQILDSARDDVNKKDLME